MANLLLRKKFFAKSMMLTLVCILSSSIMFGHAYNFFTQDKLAKTVKCYPNPAISFVNFEFDKTVEKTAVLQVFNFAGKKMTELTANNNKVTVQIDNFFRGLYVYQLRDKSGRVIESGKFQVVK